MHSVILFLFYNFYHFFFIFYLIVRLIDQFVVEKGMQDSQYTRLMWEAVQNIKGDCGESLVGENYLHAIKNEVGKNSKKEEEEIKKPKARIISEKRVRGKGVNAAIAREAKMKKLNN